MTNDYLQPTTTTDEAIRRLKRTRYRASVVRESDRMRVGVFGAIQHADTDSLTVVLPEAPTQNEWVRIQCENQLQRFTLTIEGTARHIEAREDGLFCVQFEPRLRLGPSEVRLLRPGKPDHWLRR